MNDPKKRILIVEVNWVGDVLFSTPFIRAVREAYPDSYIACLIHPRTGPMLELNPAVNELIIYDEEGCHSGLIGKARLIWSIRKKRFDKAFILHRSFTKALMTYLAGISERIGYPEKNRNYLLSKAVQIPSEELHKVEYFLNMANESGIPVSSRSYEYYIKDSDRVYIKNLLKNSGVSERDLLVTICPGGNWDPKRWPKDHYARLSDMLSEKCLAKIAIAGAEKDIALAEEIKSLMKSAPVSTCGKTDLKQLGALLERSDLVIANDTGPMHMAVAMKARVIALFGPTSPELTGPYGNGIYKVIFNNSTCDVPCYDVTCNDNECMSDIKVDMVFKAALDILADRPEGTNRPQ